MHRTSSLCSSNSWPPCSSSPRCAPSRRLWIPRSLNQVLTRSMSVVFWPIIRAIKLLLPFRAKHPNRVRWLCHREIHSNKHRRLLAPCWALCRVCWKPHLVWRLLAHWVLSHRTLLSKHSQWISHRSKHQRCSICNRFYPNQTLKIICT